MIIYKITNLITGKIYIGQTVMSLKRRWAVHKSAKRATPLCNSLKKHGVNNFIIEPLCSAFSENDLDALESELIAFYGCIAPKGYNILSGGNASQNRGRPAWNKGLKTPPEVVYKLSKAHKGQAPWNKGLATSDEARAKQSQAKLGKHINPDTEFKPGQPSAFKGRRHSPEALALISQNNGGARRIKCVQTGKEYSSIIAAVRDTGIDKTSLQELVKSGKVHKRTGLSFILASKPKV